MTTWNRSLGASTLVNGNSLLLARLNPGDTFLRTHINWGFSFSSPVAADFSLLSQAIVAFGIVTTVGDGTEVPPSPVFAPQDADPPTQRWIYWEARAPVPVAMSQDAGVIFWRDSGPNQEGSTKGQVAAQGLPGGDTLNLWASFDSGFDYAGLDVIPVIWLATSSLSKI